MHYKIEMTVALDDPTGIHYGGSAVSNIKGMLIRILREEGRGNTYAGLRVVETAEDIVVEKVDTPAQTYDVFRNARLTCGSYGEHMVSDVGDFKWSLVGLEDGDSYDSTLHDTIDELLGALIHPEEWTLISQGIGSGSMGTWEGKVNLGSN